MSRETRRPVLIFTEDLSEALELQRSIPSSEVIDGSTGPLALRRFITAHANGEVSTLIATASMTVGWRAPGGCLVLFDSEFPEELREQALARVPAW
jgi:hypothetical protein